MFKYFILLVISSTILTIFFYSQEKHSYLIIDSIGGPFLIDKVTGEAWTLEKEQLSSNKTKDELFSFDSDYCGPKKIRYILLDTNRISLNV